MKLVRYRDGDGAHLGAVKDDRIVPLDTLGFPTMLSLIEGGDAALARVRDHLASASGELAVADAALLGQVPRDRDELRQAP